MKEGTLPNTSQWLIEFIYMENRLPHICILLNPDKEKQKNRGQAYNNLNFPHININEKIVLL